MPRSLPTEKLLPLMAILSIAIIGALAIQDWGTLTSPTFQNSTNTPATTQTTPSKGLAEEVSPQEFTGLFGRKPLESENTAQKMLPQTRLELVLKGTFTHVEEDKAIALIALPNKRAEKYHIGNELPGGAELIAVKQGEVILRRNGMDERLTLPILKSKEPIAKTGIGNKATLTTEHTNASPNANRPIKGHSNTSLKDRLSALRESANNN